METNAISKSNERGQLLGVLSFWSAVAAAGSAAMIGFTSFTAFNPPDWLRIVTMLPFPALITVSIGMGIAGLKMGSGRIWSVAGLVIAGLSVVAFSIMIAIGG